MSESPNSLLPPELWRLVMLRVQIANLGSCACVCQQWKSLLALDDNFWRSKLEELFPMAASNVEHPGLLFTRIWSGREIFPVEILNLGCLEGMFASAVLRCVSINGFSICPFFSINIRYGVAKERSKKSSISNPNGNLSIGFSPSFSGHNLQRHPNCLDFCRRAWIAPTIGGKSFLSPTNPAVTAPIASPPASAPGQPHVSVAPRLASSSRWWQSSLHCCLGR